jgi:IS4 transposase
MIKQKLKIESFIGTKPNAVMTQIWTVLTALIAILILKFLRLSINLWVVVIKSWSVIKLSYLPTGIYGNG